MNSKFLNFIFILIPTLFSLRGIGQGGNPHNQQHKLNRGAYVACVDEIAKELVSSNYTNQTRLNDMINAANTYEMNYLAFYGINFIVDNDPVDNPEETALRFILSETRKNLPKIQIGVVGGNSNDFMDLLTDDIAYNPYPTIICDLPVGVSELSPAQLGIIMNPGPSATPSELYNAELLKFFTRILWYFNGDYSINAAGQQNFGKGNQSGKLNDEKSEILNSKSLKSPLRTRKDYFDWISLEHEYWSGEFIADIDATGWNDVNYTTIVDDFYQDHLNILNQVQNLIAQNNGCYVNLETYENLKDNTTSVNYNGISKFLSTSMDNQAEDIKRLPERILVTHYYKCVPNVIERYCLAIEAWGKAFPSDGVDLWPLFSAESSDYNNLHCGSPNSTWNDFWGKWMDGAFSGSFPSPCPSSPGAPYEVDESEDLFLSTLMAGASSGNLFDPGCDCCLPQTDGFQIGNYKAKGFMWFMLHFLPSQNIQKKIIAGLTIESTSLISANVFPNPTNGILNIPNDYKILQIRNINGQVIKIEPFINNSVNINLTNLESGIYILELKNDSNNSIEYVKITKN